MRKEDFFEVLGELDDDIAKGAKTAMKKKMNWQTWGGVWQLALCFYFPLKYLFFTHVKMAI